MRQVYLLLCLTGFLTGLSAQNSTPFWEPVSVAQIALPEGATPSFNPVKFQAYDLRYDALAQRLAGKEVDLLRIHALLDKLGLLHRLNAYPRHCSQGEQQRISIARALINRPDILLADEPTSALDDRHCREVLHLLQEQAADCRSALIIVTHDQRIKDQIPHTITLERHV